MLPYSTRGIPISDPAAVLHNVEVFLKWAEQGPRDSVCVRLLEYAHYRIDEEAIESFREITMELALICMAEDGPVHCGVRLHELVKTSPRQMLQPI